MLIVAAALTACAPIAEETDLSYDDRYGERTTMDLFYPEDSAPEGRPGVLFIHGGGWHSGDKDAHRSEAVRLARSGYVTATINYRLTPEGRFPAAFHDAQCALAFFRLRGAAVGLDPDRVAVAGMSAGGHLVSLLGVATGHEELLPDCSVGTTGPPAAVISAAGPQDLREYAWHERITEFVGGSPEEMPHAYELASPLDHVRAGAPPYLFLHGTFDVFVDVSDSERMRDALTAEGNDARLLTLALGGHILNAGTDVGHLDGQIPLTAPEAWPAVADFLDATLGSPP